MAAVTTIAAVVAAAATLASTTYSLTRKGPKAPKTSPTPQLASGTPADKSAAQLAGLRPQDQANSPNFLESTGFKALTPLQQRATIATQATQGDSRYAGGEVRDYYRNLVQRTLVDDSGGISDYSAVLPVERQYASQTLGQTPREQSTESFLSAVLRG